jgi:threonylcarbamoyladenosine tRNA methylthiotransferase MtaB
MEALRSQLMARGFREVPFGRPSDLTVVNTCTVTAAGDSDGRKMLRRARRASPRGRVVATGCYAQRDPLGLANLRTADLILGNAGKGDLGQYLELLKRSPREEGMPSCSEIAVGTSASPRAFLPHAPGVATARTRATLKIQDGCDDHCTYCIIPKVRGPSISRPWREVLRDARNLVAAGTKEIALTGINAGSYGLDGAPGAGPSLAWLLKRLEEVEGLLRIRLSSVEPGLVTDELLEMFADSPKVCPHLHIPAQSGDDEILRRMGRTYRSEDYERLVSRVRSACPYIALGVDVMVGFPGESGAQFDRSRRFLESLEPSYLHVFSYSARPGTPATGLGREVPPQEAARRSRVLRELDRSLRKGHMQQRQGERDAILVEQEKDGGVVGLTGDYLRVVAVGGSPEIGEMATVVIGEPLDDARVRGICVVGREA